MTDALQGALQYEENTVRGRLSMIPLICRWYREHRRDLPWRQGKNAYHTWVSEIMLQQTRVEAVIPYYERFLSELPTVQALAACPEDRLLKLWEGLGYYNRVRNMQKAARIITDGAGTELEKYFSGAPEIPGRQEETEIVKALLVLPGIGNYTAGAIASIAFDLPVPAVDGNVLRVLSRVWGDNKDIMKQSVRRSYEHALEKAMRTFFSEEKTDAFQEDDSENAASAQFLENLLPGDLNQGFMDLGALICLPNGAPLCGQCPLGERKLCRAHVSGREQEFPVKAQKKARKIEHRTILLIHDGERVVLRRRPKKGLLASMYEFPNYFGILNRKQVLQEVKDMGMHPLRVRKLEPSKHIFSHIEWHMTGYEVLTEENGSRAIRQEDKRSDNSPWLLAAVSEVRARYAIPSAYEAYASLLGRMIDG